MRTIEKPDLRELKNKYSNWEVGIEEYIKQELPEIA